MTYIPGVMTVHLMLPSNVAVNVIDSTAGATTAKLALATRPLGAKSLAGSEVSCMVGLHRTASKYHRQQAAASS